MTSPSHFSTQSSLLQALEYLAIEIHHVNRDKFTLSRTDIRIEVVIAPPGLFLLLAREHLRKEIEVASQNVFDKPNGAFTGEISAEQLKDSGIGWALAGHSERRVILGENDSVGGVS